jgi:hypothetical protein
LPAQNRVGKGGGVAQNIFYPLLFFHCSLQLFFIIFLAKTATTSDWILPLQVHPWRS